MTYEDLAVEDNFSEDEIPYALGKEILRMKKDKKALIRAKMIQEQLHDLKSCAIKGMKSIVNTINAIDENSKKIVYKHFD